MEEAEQFAALDSQFLPGLVYDVLVRASGGDDVPTAETQVSGERYAFFGIWRGSDDLVDNAHWVTKERATWQNRPGRRA